MSATPAIPINDSPDFIAFLQARLDVRAEVALAALGEWLTHYAPTERRRIRVLERPASGDVLAGQAPAPT